VNVSAAPRSTVIMPRVTMKELISPHATKPPFTAPTAMPSTTMTMIVPGASSPPFALRLAPTTAHNARAEPTERSMLPERITSVIPQATMISTDACLPTFSRLLEVRNCGSSRASTPPMMRSATKAVPPKASLRSTKERRESANRLSITGDSLTQPPLSSREVGSRASFVLFPFPPPTRRHA